MAGLTTFLTFGSGEYEFSLRRIEREAKASGFFDRVAIRRPADLAGPFAEKHGKLLRYCRRGYGYWLWKPHLILRQLLECRPGDLLVYADAGCTVNARGAARFAEYRRLLHESPLGVLGFQMGFSEKHYTKGDAFEALEAWNLADTGQVMATIILWRRCETSIAFAREWLASAERYQLLVDTPSTVPNDPGFVDHRHDQSLFSLLAKLRGATLIHDETYADPAAVDLAIPFLATRRRDKAPGRIRQLGRTIRGILPETAA